MHKEYNLYAPWSISLRKNFLLLNQIPIHFPCIRENKIQILITLLLLTHPFLKNERTCSQKKKKLRMQEHKKIQLQEIYDHPQYFYDLLRISKIEMVFYALLHWELIEFPPKCENLNKNKNNKNESYCAYHIFFGHHIINFHPLKKFLKKFEPPKN